MHHSTILINHSATCYTHGHAANSDKILDVQKHITDV